MRGSILPRLKRLVEVSPGAEWLALAAGALLTLAFAPFHIFPLAFVSPALLFLTWQHASPGRAAWRGFLFGLGLFGSGVSWVYVSLHNFGNMPGPLAAVATLLFAALLAAYFALFGFVYVRFARHASLTVSLWRWTALWVLFEWLRSWLFTGFPWLNLGYSQSDTWLAGYAPLLGVYGVSLAVAATAALLAAALLEPRAVLRRFLPVVLALWGIGAAGALIDWTRPADGDVRVALVQGDVPLAIKWRPEYRERIIDHYRAMSERALDADLIVWPEAAIPGYLDQVRDTLDGLRATAREFDVDFVLGVIERETPGRATYNSVVSVGRHDGVYRKQHLVPFGEFLPLKYFLGWLLDYLHIPMSDFSRGAAGQPLLQAAGQRLGVSVCYEDAFGEEVIQALPQAGLLVNVSEDAWFGDSFAPHQRLQMARLRALEAGRPMLRAANTGPSAAIDHRGQVLARSGQFQPALLRATVTPRDGLTPYARWGNAAVLVLILALLGGALWRARSSPAPGRPDAAGL